MEKEPTTKKMVGLLCEEERSSELASVLSDYVVCIGSPSDHEELRKAFVEAQQAGIEVMVVDDSITSQSEALAAALCDAAGQSYCRIVFVTQRESEDDFLRILRTCCGIRDLLVCTCIDDWAAELKKLVSAPCDDSWSSSWLQPDRTRELRKTMPRLPKPKGGFIARFSKQEPAPAMGNVLSIPGAEEPGQEPEEPAGEDGKTQPQGTTDADIVAMVEGLQPTEGAEEPGQEPEEPAAGANRTTGGDAVSGEQPGSQARQRRKRRKPSRPKAATATRPEAERTGDGPVPFAEEGTNSSGSSLEEDIAGDTSELDARLRQPTLVPPKNIATWAGMFGHGGDRSVFNPKTIAVASLKNGLGCTKLCCTLGLELAAIGHKAAVLMSDGHEVRDLKQALSNVIRLEGGGFRYEGCDFWYWPDFEKYANRYEYCIADCGVIATFKARGNANVPVTLFEAAKQLELAKRADVVSPRASFFDAANLPIVMFSAEPYDFHLYRSFLASCTLEELGRFSWMVAGAGKDMAGILRDSLASDVLRNDEFDRIFTLYNRPTLFTTERFSSDFGPYRKLLEPVLSPSEKGRDAVE